MMDTDILFRLVKNGEVAKLKNFLSGKSHLDLTTVRDEKGSPLTILAALNGKPDMVRFLCESGLSSAVCSDDGWTSLFAACVGNHLNVVKYILETCSDNSVNQQEKINGDTCLIKACISGYYEIVELLLDYGADTSIKNHSGNHALHYCCTSANIDIFRLILLQGGHLMVNVPNNNSLTPLHISAEGSKKEVVVELIEHGANIHAHDIFGISSFMRACEKLNLNMMEVLLEHGSDINESDHNNDTPLMKVAQMCPRTMGRNVSESQIQVIKYLISHSANVDHVNSEGYTALMLAIKARNTNIALLLIHAGCQLDLLDQGKWTALIRATSTGDRTIVREILKYKADPNILSGEGYTALHYAVIFNRIDLATDLIRSGSKIAILSKTNKTPLQCSKSDTFVRVMLSCFRREQIRVILLLSTRARNAHGHLIENIYRRLYSRNTDTLRKVISFL